MGQSAPSSSKHINPTKGERVVIPFYPTKCCGSSTVIGVEHRDLPQKLRDAGVTQEMWDRWMADLDANVVPKSNTCCYTTCQVIGWVFVIPGLICCCLPHNKWVAHQKAIRQWVDNINDDLDKLGLYCKTQTMQAHRDKVTIMNSTVSFALTKSETELMKKEPHVVMEGDCCSSCLGCPSNASRVV